MGTAKPGAVFGLRVDDSGPSPEAGWLRQCSLGASDVLQGPGLPPCLSLGALSLTEPGAGFSHMVLRRGSRDDLFSWFLLPCLPCPASCQGSWTEGRAHARH